VCPCLAESFFVGLNQIEPGYGILIILSGGFLVPLDRLATIHGDTPAVLVHRTDIVLGIAVTGIGFLELFPEQGFPYVISGEADTGSEYQK
jgi:hypothetical protein